MTSTSPHCHGCGALVNLADKQCWLCFQELRGQSLRASPPAKVKTFAKGPATPSPERGPEPGPAASPAAKQAPQTSAANVPNPFAEEAVEPQYFYRNNARAVLGQLFAILAILPATGIAFLFMCSAVAESGQNHGRGLFGASPNGVAMLTGLVGASVVFVCFFMLIVSLGKKTVYRIELK